MPLAQPRVERWSSDGLGCPVDCPVNALECPTNDDRHVTARVVAGRAKVIAKVCPRNGRVWETIHSKHILCHTIPKWLCFVVIRTRKHESDNFVLLKAVEKLTNRLESIV